MATQATAQYYVRQSGNDTNGGGYDSGIAGAGTNYCDQDAPVVALTGLSCTQNGTTLTQTGATFTALMVGNGVQITGGTNFLKDIYWITGYTDANNVILDRTPATAGAGSVGTGNVGGALATFKCLSNGGTATANPLNTKTQLVPGNTINIRGGGSDDPDPTGTTYANADYNFSGGYWTFPSGNLTAGPISVVGYNGRPEIKYCGLLFQTATCWVFKHLKAVQTVNTFQIYGLANGVGCVMQDIILDQGGFDATVVTMGTVANVLASVTMDCEIRNQGSTSAGTSYAIATNSGTVINCYIHGVRGGACAMLASNGLAVFSNNIVSGCKGTTTAALSIGVSGQQFVILVANNTIDGGAGDGILASTVYAVSSQIYNNNITNHAGSGKYGLKVTANSGTVATNDKIKTLLDYNNYYGNTANYSGVSAGSHDLAVDPQYTNAAGGDFSISGNI